MGSAQAVNDAMTALSLAIGAFNNPAPMVAAEIPPPIGVEEEAIDCIKLAWAIEQLQALDVIYCPGL